jgi:hypothetical protein
LSKPKIGLQLACRSLVPSGRSPVTHEGDRVVVGKREPGRIAEWPQRTPWSNEDLLASEII